MCISSTEQFSPGAKKLPFPDLRVVGSGGKSRGVSLEWRGVEGHRGSDVDTLFDVAESSRFVRHHHQDVLVFGIRTLGYCNHFQPNRNVASETAFDEVQLLYEILETASYALFAHKVARTDIQHSTSSSMSDARKQWYFVTKAIKASLMLSSGCSWLAQRVCAYESKLGRWKNPFDDAIRGFLAKHGFKL